MLYILIAVVAVLSALYSSLYTNKTSNISSTQYHYLMAIEKNLYTLNVNLDTLYFDSDSISRAAVRDTLDELIRATKSTTVKFTPELQRALTNIFLKLTTLISDLELISSQESTIQDRQHSQSNRQLHTIIQALSSFIKLYRRFKYPTF